MFYFFVFFFSSRRRHTRCLSDWSSDVCSSDLDEHGDLARPRLPQRGFYAAAPGLAVGDDDERAGIAALAEQLLVLLDQTKPPSDPFLDIRVPGRGIFEPDRKSVV